MSKSNLNIRFYLRTNHVNKDGICAIMVRITANGERTVFSTKLSDSSPKTLIVTPRVLAQANSILERLRFIGR